MPTTYLISFGCAFGASVVLTFVVRALARRFNFVAKPRADRWHQKPTALFGGVGIFAAFILTFLVMRPSALAGEGILLVCASGMFVLGTVDDLLHLKPYAKLVVQIVCAAALSRFGLRLHWVDQPVLDQAITIFWLVGVTNAINLLDNLDGAAGGVAAIASGFLIYFCHVSGNSSLAMMMATFCGSIAGFLVFNVNPASIFMGDCGSLFIGFMLAGVTMVGNEAGPKGPVGRNVIAVLFVPVLLLLIPILDTTLVTISRKLHGRPVSQGGRDHTSHRLVALGMSDRTAAATLWLLAAASGGVAVMVQSLSTFIGFFLVVSFCLGLLFFGIVLGRVKVYEPVENVADPKGRALLPTLADIAHKRRMFEVLNDVVLIVLAFYGSFLIRFDGTPPDAFLTRFVHALPIVLGIQLAGFLTLGLYRGVWRYTSMSDLPRIAGAVLGAWAASMIAIWAIYGFGGFAGFSRGALVADGVFLFFAVAGSRIALRIFHAWYLARQPRPEASRVLIYGAGDGGESLVRELLKNHDLGLVPIGFLDDDPRTHGKIIHGVPVLGASKNLREVANTRDVQEVLISSGLEAQAAGWQATFEAACKQHGLRLRRMRIALE